MQTRPLGSWLQDVLLKLLETPGLNDELLYFMTFDARVMTCEGCTQAVESVVQGERQQRADKAPARAGCVQFHGDSGKSSGSSRLSMAACSSMTMGLEALGLPLAGTVTDDTVKTE